MRTPDRNARRDRREEVPDQRLSARSPQGVLVQTRHHPAAKGAKQPGQKYETKVVIMMDRMGYFEHVGALYLLITGQLIGGENGRFEACLRYTGGNQEKFPVFFYHGKQQLAGCQSGGNGQYIRADAAATAALQAKRRGLNAPPIAL